MTTPPYLSVLARFGSKLRGADHAHWVMDLYPDVMVAHGMLAEKGLLHRVLATLARWGIGGTRCAAVLTLGPDMAERIRGDHLTSNIEWVPLWGQWEKPNMVVESRSEDVARLRRARAWADDEIVVMYSGNMGLGHRFGEILQVAERWNAGLMDPITQRARPLRFVFYGGGKRRGEIERWMEQHPEAPVELHDYVDSVNLADHLASADVHWVSLDAAWTGTMVPSKLQGIFAVGRPVIFLGSPESSLGQWVKQSGGGWVVRPDDLTGLLAAMDEAFHPSIREKRGKAAFDFALIHFNKETNLARLSTLFGNPTPK